VNNEDIDYILNILRRGTIHWKGRSQCLNRNRYKVSVNGKEIWARDCDGCGERHLQKDRDLEVDHIKEVGPYSGNLHEYAERMYCSQDNLQALCFSCHSQKTSKFNATLRYSRKLEPRLKSNDVL
jgi:5-methylcytosine-specific restriction endonuclease McrA